MNSYAKINLDAFSHNLLFIKSLLKPDVRIMAVVKANAYGHGVSMIARRAESDGVDMLGVANLEEAIELRVVGIKIPILLLGGIMEDQIKTFMDHEFSTVVYSREIFSALQNAARKAGKKVKIHLKVDTGMRRLGFSPDDLISLISRHEERDSLFCEGIMTHLASAGEKNKEEFTKLQLKIFNKIIEDLKSQGIIFPLVHCANSAGVIDFPESHFNMVRPGIALYGASPFCEEQNWADNELPRSKLLGIKPVLTWETRIINLSRVSKGKPVSYGGTFKTKRESIIATIPVGYADGYNRLLSNKTEVLIKRKFAPQVGVICMDLTMIDVTGIEGASVGDEVVLIGTQGKEEIKATGLSDKIGAIPYEILCGIGNRVSRIYT